MVQVVVIRGHPLEQVPGSGAKEKEKDSKKGAPSAGATAKRAGVPVLVRASGTLFPCSLVPGSSG